MPGHGTALIGDRIGFGGLNRMTLAVLLGANERLFDDVQAPGFEPVKVIHSPHVTNLRYRIGR